MRARGAALAAGVALLAGLLGLLAGSPAAASDGERAAPRAERSPSAARERWRPHLAAARRYAAGRPGRARIAIVDPSGRLVQSRGSETTESASVVKVLFLIAFLREHRDEALTRSERRLLSAMIRRSSNEAGTRVRDEVGRARIDAVARDAGLDHFSQAESWGLSRIAAGEMARMMWRLDRYLPKRHRAYAKRLLATVVHRQRWGIAESPPPGWRLLVKGGWGVGPGRVQNQVALLERGRRRVGIAVFVDGGPSPASMRRTMAGVSERLLRGLPR